MTQSGKVGIAAVVIGLVGLLSAWLPQPFQQWPVYQIYAGVIFVVIVLYVATYRATGSFGIFANPLKIAFVQVGKEDEPWLLLGLAMMLGPVVSIIARVVI